MEYEGLSKIAQAITPDVIPAEDATGAFVASLTEAVMGMTSGLVRIADAIERLADIVEDKESQLTT